MLTSLEKQDIVLPILFYYVTTYNFGSTAVCIDACFAICFGRIVQYTITVMKVEQSVALLFLPKPCLDAELCKDLLTVLILLLPFHLTVYRVKALLIICIDPLDEGLALSQIDILIARLIYGFWR